MYKGLNLLLKIKSVAIVSISKILDLFLSKNSPFKLFISMKKIVAVLFITCFSFSAAFSQTSVVTKREIKYEIKVKTKEELKNLDWAKIEKNLGRSNDFTKCLVLEIEDYQSPNTEKFDKPVKFSVAVTSTEGESAEEMIEQVKVLVADMVKE